MIDQYPPANGVLTSLIWRKTAAGGETSLSGYDNASQALSYTPGQEQVYLNGILLVRGDDYTATNGTSITGLSALAANDFVQINCYNNFSVASTPATSITGTIANNQLANSAITINGNAVSLGGSVSLPGDIESVTASSPLTGGGTSGAVTIGIQSASTSQSGAVQLTDSTSSTSTSTAATPNAVKSAYDLANGAIQKTLTTTTGDIIYASSANTPARLGIGSSGQYLTVSGGVPVWGSVSSGGITLISTSTPSGASSINFTSISGTYKHLLLTWNGVGTSDNSTGFDIRFNNDSSGIYSNNDVSGATSVGDSPYLFMEGNAIGGGNENTGHGYLYIYDYASTSYWKTYNGQSAYYDGDFGWRAAVDKRGMWRSTSAITSVDVIRRAGSGTISVASGGVVKLWGLS